MSHFVPEEQVRYLSFCRIGVGRTRLGIGTLVNQKIRGGPVFSQVETVSLLVQHRLVVLLRERLFLHGNHSERVLLGLAVFFVVVIEEVTNELVRLWTEKQLVLRQSVLPHSSGVCLVEEAQRVVCFLEGVPNLLWQEGLLEGQLLHLQSGFFMPLQNVQELLASFLVFLGLFYGEDRTFVHKIEFTLLSDYRATFQRELFRRVLQKRVLLRFRASRINVVDLVVVLSVLVHFETRIELPIFVFLQTHAAFLDYFGQIDRGILQLSQDSLGHESRPSQVSVLLNAQLALSVLLNDLALLVKEQTGMEKTLSQLFEEVAFEELPKAMRWIEVAQQLDSPNEVLHLGEENMASFFLLLQDRLNALLVPEVVMV